MNLPGPGSQWEGSISLATAEELGHQKDPLNCVGHETLCQGEEPEE